jgi:hypothetical protein
MSFRGGETADVVVKADERRLIPTTEATDRLIKHTATGSRVLPGARRRKLNPVPSVSITSSL